MDKLDDILAKARAIKVPAGISPPPIARGDWEEAVGSRIACRAQPLRLERGVLSIRVATAAWANELALLADDIIAQLADKGLVVRSLRFSVGAVTSAPKSRRSKPRRAARPDAELPDPLRDQVAGIADDELRGALSEAAAKSLSIKEE